MARYLDSFRRCTISSPIWNSQHVYSEASLILKDSPCCGKLRQGPGDSTTVMAILSSRCRGWWQGIRISGGDAAGIMKAGMCIRARKSTVGCMRLWERVGVELEPKVKCSSSSGGGGGGWGLVWRKVQASMNMNWMKSSGRRRSSSCSSAAWIGALIYCPQKIMQQRRRRSRPMNDLLYDPVSYALNFDDGCYTAPNYRHPPPHYNVDYVDIAGHLSANTTPNTPCLL